MKKWLIIASVALLLYAVYAKQQFSNTAVEKWLVGHSVKVMSGSDGFCDDFADNIEVSLISYSAQGNLEVKGGKNELCAYIKQSAAAMTVMQAHTQSQFSDIKITRKGFPWITAEVSYIEHGTLTMGKQTIYSKSNDTMVLKRTLGGMKVTKLDSKSESGWYPIP